MELDSPAMLAAFGFLGAHALQGFGLILVLALCGVATLRRLGLRYGLRREESRWPPLAYLLGHLALGLGVIAGAALFFAEIAEALGDGHQLGQLDQVFSDALRGSTSHAALQAFAVLTHLGDPQTLTVLCVSAGAALVWRKHYTLTAGWVLAIAGNALLNPALKRIFERARPVHDTSLVNAEGWSFPSGHASSSVVAYGMLAYVLLRTLPPHWHGGLRTAALLLATALALATGASRVFLQVHFLSDVLAGFASGLAWLVVCIATLELMRYRQARLQTP